MLPVERLDRIKKIFKTRKNIKISELSKELGVSEMTIHRDVKPLIEDGMLVKTFGGVSLANTEVNYNDSKCIICNRNINKKMAYRLILSNDTIETACCAHCGLLRHRQINEKVIQAFCYDFLRQTTLNVKEASYIMNTSINMGCCQPQVLTFEWKEHADKFIKGFGGKVLSFDLALEVILDKMNHKHHDCNE